jgi:hypothetical protein
MSPRGRLVIAQVADVDSDVGPFRWPRRTPPHPLPRWGHRGTAHRAGSAQPYRAAKQKPANEQGSLVRSIPSGLTQTQANAPALGEGWGGETRRSARTWPNHRFGPHHQSRLAERWVSGIDQRSLNRDVIFSFDKGITVRAINESPPSQPAPCGLEGQSR